MADDPFELFWADYPRKVGKLAAQRQWAARLKAGVTVAAMLDGEARYLRYLRTERTEPRFVKHAATFLGRDLWFADEWTPNGKQTPDTGEHKRRLLGAR